MEQKEPSVFPPEGNFTFGGVEGENDGEDVALPQMEEDLAATPSVSYLMLISDGQV